MFKILKVFYMHTRVAQISRYIKDNESQCFHWKGNRKLQVGKVSYKQKEKVNEPCRAELY